MDNHKATIKFSKSTINKDLITEKINQDKMDSKMVLVVVAVLLAAVLTVSGQNPTGPQEGVNASTSCQFEDNPRDCRTCCQDLGYDSGALYRPPVIIPGVPIVDGYSCVCVGLNLPTRSE